MIDNKTTANRFHSIWMCEGCCCSVAKLYLTLCDLSFTMSQSLLKFMSFELVMLFNHLILCHPLLLLPLIFPSIKVFSKKSTLCTRWPKYWSFSLGISPSHEYLELISFRMTSLVAQMVNRLLALQETQVQSLGQEDFLEKEMATPSSILVWKIPWMEEPGRLQSMGSQRVRHAWASSLSLPSGLTVFTLYVGIYLDKWQDVLVLLWEDLKIITTNQEPERCILFVPRLGRTELFMKQSKVSSVSKSGRVLGLYPDFPSRPPKRTHGHQTPMRHCRHCLSEIAVGAAMLEGSCFHCLQSYCTTDPGKALLPDILVLGTLLWVQRWGQGYSLPWIHFSFLLSLKITPWTFNMHLLVFFFFFLLLFIYLAVSDLSCSTWDLSSSCTELSSCDRPA